MFFFYAAVLAWTSKKPRWLIGSIFFRSVSFHFLKELDPSQANCLIPRASSLALSIKMNFLLYLPALLYLFFTSLGLLRTLLQLNTLLFVQLLLANPFFESVPLAQTYFLSAFNFGREFEWEWTVNWRWVGREAFESSGFAKGLLGLNGLVILVLGIKWAGEEGGVVKLIKRGLNNPLEGAVKGRPSPECELSS